MAVYTNDLRLKEIATGDESGTWGDSTNTNLELIAEAFSFGTESITTNADTHTTTIADGSTDPGRSIFLKYTGTLDSACTITIGPNTVSKLWFIENATSGSQNIIIKQGSGATVTIPNGQTKAIYSDGAGSGGAMVDAFASLNVVDLSVEDDLAVSGLATIGETLGVTGVLTANAGVVVDNITIDGTEIDLSSGDLTLDVAGDIILDTDGASVKLKDGGSDFGSLGSSAGLFVAGTACGIRLHSGGTKIFPTNASGAAADGTVDLGAVGGAWNNVIFSGNISHSGSLTVDVAGDITLDADGADINFSDGGTQFGKISKGGGQDLILDASIADKDIFLTGTDGSSAITALALDMSDAGRATFNGKASFGGAIAVGQTTFTGGGVLADFHGSGSGVGAQAAFYNDHNTAGFFAGIAGNTSGNVILFNNANTNMEFYTNAAIAMTLDNSGNLFVSKTSSSVSTDGVELQSTGFVRATVDGDTVLQLNRRTSDGTLINFRKDGSTVGGISANSSRLLIESNGGSGLRFDGSSYTPFASGSASDGGVDLGFSSGRFKELFISQAINNGTNAIAFSGGAFAGDGSGNDANIDLGRTNRRFQNLYLSGGVFLGGAGSANELDDYEEGTWTPTIQSTGTASFSGAKYTKVGRLVTCCFYVASISNTTSSAAFQVSLPFTAAFNDKAAPVGFLGIDIDLGQITGAYIAATTFAQFYQVSASTSYQNLRHQNFGASTAFYAAFTYMAA